MPLIITPFGTIDALPDSEFFPDGTVQSCIAARACPHHSSLPWGCLFPNSPPTPCASGSSLPSPFIQTA